MGKVIQVVVYKSVSDEAKLAKYAELALPAIEAAGGKFLARGIPIAVKEAGEFTRTVDYVYSGDYTGDVPTVDSSTTIIATKTLWRRTA